MTTPFFVNTKFSPTDLKTSPTNVLPKSRSRHRPSTSSGKATGRSMMVLTNPFPTKSKRDSVYPMGREKSMTSTVEIRPVMSESFNENRISSLKRLFHTS